MSSTNPIKLPFYARMVVLLIGFYVLISMLSIAQNILLPLIYSILIAILLNPVVNYLASKKISLLLSITIVIITVILLFSGLIFLLSYQIARFGELLPQISEKFQALLRELSAWLSDFLGMSEQKMRSVVAQTKKEFTPDQGEAIGTTLITTGHILAAVLLTPVYVFMLLYYKKHIIEFIYRLFGAGNDKPVEEVLTETKGIIQSYLVGLFTEILIMAILNSIGLLILGMDYAVLLGVMGALLNVVPYLGGIIAQSIFMLVALVTKTPIYVLYIFIMYTTLQFIDNNIIVPRIVGSKVKLNAMVSLIAVIAGAALWGIPGMFLAIPVTAIIKLILDKIDGCKPWGFLLGEYSAVTIKKKKIK